jgi:hypothetical protein
MKLLESYSAHRPQGPLCAVKIVEHRPQGPLCAVKQTEGGKRT